MLARYICSTESGPTVAIDLSDKTPIEVIKSKASDLHQVKVLDVLSELLFGSLEDAVNEVEEEDEE